MEPEEPGEPEDEPEPAPEPAPAGRPRRDWRIGGGIAALYVLAGLISYWHLLPHLATAQASSGRGDSALFDWFIAYTPYALGHGANPFVTHVANYPFGVNLLNNTSVEILGLIMSPVTVLFGPIATVNLLMILSYPASAGGGYLLARRFVDWRPAAFTAGLLYGFCPYMVGQGLGHIHLTFVPLPPLIFLALHELFVLRQVPAVKCGLMLGGLIVAQFLISTEVLATTALFCALTLVVLAIAYRRDVTASIRHAWPGLAAAVAVAGALLAFPLYELLAGLGHIRGTIPGYLDYFSSLVGPLLPTSLMEFGTAHLKALGDKLGGNVPENGTYLGLPLVVLVLAAPILIRRRIVWVAGGMAMIAFILSLGATFHFGLARFANVGSGFRLPGDIIAHLPKLNNAFPVRYSLFVVLFVSVVLAVSLEALRIGRRSSLLPAVVAFVVLLPLVPAWPYGSEGHVAVPSYFTTSDVNALAPGETTLVYPLPINVDPAAMIWQAEAGMRFKLVGGYFVLPAKTGSQYWTPTFTQETLTDLHDGKPVDPTPDLRRQLIDQLGAWHVTAVVARPDHSDPEGFFTWLIGRPPDARTGGMIEWYHLVWA